MAYRHLECDVRVRPHTCTCIHPAGLSRESVIYSDLMRPDMFNKRGAKGQFCSSDVSWR